MESREKSILTKLSIIIAITVVLCLALNAKTASASNPYINVVSKLVYYDNDYSAINIDLYLNYYYDFGEYCEITTNKVEGSNDGENWTTLNVWSSSSAPDRYVEGRTRLNYRLNIKNGNGQYRYYRMDIGFSPVNSNTTFYHCTYDVTDIYKYTIIDSNGFSKELDGWFVLNESFCFGYNGDKGTAMPGQRLTEVFNLNLTRELRDKLVLFCDVMSYFKGYCYGMALTAIAEYNGQIELSDEFGFGGALRLNERAMDMSKIFYKDTGTECYTLNGHKDVIKLIEHCFLAQGSCEMYEVEVYKPEDETTYFKELIEYLSDVNNKPLLVTCFHHAMVLETASKPIKCDDGWVKLPLYDVNLPSNANYIKNRHSYYETESELWINTISGKVKYIYAPLGIKSKCNRDEIHFFDPSKLSPSFFDFSGKLKMSNETSYFGTYNNLEIKNSIGEVIFKSVDGDIVYSSDECKIKEWASDNQQSKFVIIEFGDEQFKIDTQEDFSIISEDALVCVDIEEEVSCSIDMKQCTVDVETSKENCVEVAIQDDITTDKPSSIIVGSELKNNQNITVMKKGEEAKVESKNNLIVDIILEDSDNASEYKDVSLASIDNIIVDELEIEQKISVVEIGNINEIVKENGIEYTQEAIGLPNKINIVLENGDTLKSDIIWDLTSVNNKHIYDPTIIEEQQFYIIGQVILPQEISNNYQLPLTCKVKVIIKAMVENEKLEGVDDKQNNVDDDKPNYTYEDKKEHNETEINKPGDILSIKSIYLLLVAFFIMLLFCFIKGKSVNKFE